MKTALAVFALLALATGCQAITPSYQAEFAAPAQAVFAAIPAPQLDVQAVARSSGGYGYEWNDDGVALAVVLFPFRESEPGKAMPFAITKKLISPSKVLTVDLLAGTTEGPEAEGWLGLGVTLHPPQLDKLVNAGLAFVGLQDDVSIRLGAAVARIESKTEVGFYLKAQFDLLGQ